MMEPICVLFHAEVSSFLTLDDCKNWDSCFIIKIIYYALLNLQLAIVGCHKYSLLHEHI